jgi:plastocyanin
MAARITVVEEVGQPPPDAEPPEEEPAEEAPAAEPAEAPAPAEVTVEMLDFTYEPLEVSVVAGTTIIWVNAGEFEHSATADDAAWDTGVYAPGGQQSITFDAPGAYPYYCLLHGTPGGNGMSGTVIVTEE